MLISLGAGALSALCCGFAWRALQRCRAVTAASSSASAQGSASTLDGFEPFEQRLVERESNEALNLARRNVRGLAQVAFTGGLGLAFWALTGGRSQQPEAIQAFALGSVGAIACLGLRRRIGSLADDWRSLVNRKARRRQGVDQPERTG